MKAENNKLSNESIIFKLEGFCAYQERCISDVIQKLYKLKVPTGQHNYFIKYLKDNNFLDEKRFLKNFIKGKLLNNKWGKIKIKYELIKKHIPENIINEGLLEIDDIEYTNVFKNLFSKKIKEYPKPLTYQDKEKILRYMISKGFEMDLVNKEFKI